MLTWVVFCCSARPVKHELALAWWSPCGRPDMGFIDQIASVGVESIRTSSVGVQSNGVSLVGVSLFGV